MAIDELMVMGGYMDPPVPGSCSLACSSYRGEGPGSTSESRPGLLRKHTEQEAPGSLKSQSLEVKQRGLSFSEPPWLILIHSRVASH